jgi:hypothetical protein
MTLCASTWMEIRKVTTNNIFIESQDYKITKKCSAYWKNHNIDRKLHFEIEILNRSRFDFVRLRWRFVETALAACVLGLSLGAEIDFWGLSLARSRRWGSQRTLALEGMLLVDSIFIELDLRKWIFWKLIGFNLQRKLNIHRKCYTAEILCFILI